MSRKKRHIADFDAVASVPDIKPNDDHDTKNDHVDNNDDKTEIKNDIVTNDSINTDNKNNHNVNHKNVIDTILNNEKSKSSRVQRGLYLDRDIDDALNKLYKKGGKGTKSDIINDLLRKEFEDRGLL